MKPIISCEFNMDTACVELCFLDGTMLAIDSIAVEDEIVPIAATRTFAEKNQIGFIPFPKTDHRFIDPNKMTEAIQYIETFFEY